MKKSLATCALALLAWGWAQAGPVTPERAATVAKAFWSSSLNGKGDLNAVGPLEGWPYDGIHLFTHTGGGFVMVAGDDASRPILGYSASGRLDPGNLPVQLRAWLDGYQQQLDYLREQGGTPYPADAEAWACLESGSGMKDGEGVGPLLTTRWDQSDPYNDLCPAGTATGCAATAQAQLMKYWNHPAFGTGSHSYTHDTYGQQAADFAHTLYDWDHMPDMPNWASSSQERLAVATLMYHIGVGVEMNYGLSFTGGSGAHNYNFFGDISPSSQTALMKHFKYRPDMVTLARADYSDAEYALLLKAELDSSRPILFSGRDPNGGHSFVIDGYNSSNQFHINWGWGSYCDGYYTIGSLNPSAGGTGGNNGTYNQDNVALVGIRPNGNFGTGGTVTATVSGTGGTVSGAGSYGFGDTVSLLATASPGYRFAGWTDHDRFNPKEFIGNGGDYNFTAMFEPISGDTLSYCGNGRQITSYGLGAEGTCVWGIRLPASLLTAGHDLTAVQIYIPTEGTYTMTVYTGASVSSCVPRASSTATFTASDAAAWHTLTLDTTVAISGTQSVWIMFENSDADYPAAITYYGGRPEGCLWGGNMQEMAISFSFMIRGIFITPASPLPIPTVVVVSGPNTLEEGEPGTFRALANEDATVEWTLQGATPATGSGITVTA